VGGGGKRGDGWNKRRRRRSEGEGLL